MQLEPWEAGSERQFHLKTLLHCPGLLLCVQRIQVPPPSLQELAELQNTLRLQCCFSPGLLTP